MPRKSKAQLDEEFDYALLGVILADPNEPADIRVKAGGTRSRIRSDRAEAHGREGRSGCLST